MKTKVFEMDIRFGIQLPRRLDKRVDKLIILIPPHALLSQSEIQVIVEKLLVICAAVEDHGKTPVGMDTGT
jgi:hypothetical protein